MKVAFDENVPPALVKVFAIFANERQLRKRIGTLEIVSARDFVPKAGDVDHKKKDDAPWITRFARAGGKVIISGDTRMRFVPHERLALIQRGMLVFFFDKKWNQWEFFEKCSLLIYHWPAIARRAKGGKAPAFWYIPLSWRDTAKLRKVPTDDPRMLKIERKHKARSVARKKKADLQNTISQIAPHEPSLLDLMVAPKEEQ